MSALRKWLTASAMVLVSLLAISWSFLPIYTSHWMRRVNFGSVQINNQQVPADIYFRRTKRRGGGDCPRSSENRRSLLSRFRLACQSAKLASEMDMTGRSGEDSATETKRSGFGNGRGRQSTVSTAQNTVVVIPSVTARVRTATAVNVGSLHSM